jgi:hypothetical protein
VGLFTCLDLGSASQSAARPRDVNGTTQPGECKGAASRSVEVPLRVPLRGSAQNLRWYRGGIGPTLEGTVEDLGRALQVGTVEGSARYSE